MNSVNQKNILLVEDDRVTATIQMRQLKKYGYSVHHTITGEDAAQTIINNARPVSFNPHGY